jgi:2',3'-cyclic-nucleotide 2'-phosphodiesterase (5'-nucleotidase family)
MSRQFIPEYELGNLVTTLMNSAYPGNDFVIINSGGFRTTWVPGIIQ